MTRKQKKLIGAGVLLAALSGVIVAGFSVNRSQRQAVEVRVEPVEARDLVAVVSASGWIKPRRAVDVQADIMGRITELAVEEGDHVESGQLLLRLDPTQYEAAVARARAGVSEAMAREAQVRANLIQSQQALTRLYGIVEREPDLVSRQSLEEAETQLVVQQALHEAALHGVEQARATLHEAEDRLSKSVIRAPISGVVTRLNVEAGETAIVGTTNNPGSLLLTISDLSVMEAVVRVDETDVPHVSLGDSTSITIDAFPRRTFTGRVTKIGHSAVRPPGQAQGGQPQAVDFEIIITLDQPPSALRPDLSATAEIVTGMRKNVLTIPIIALTVREQQELEPLPQEDPGTRKLAQSVAEQRDIEGVFEVLSGLAAGDSVVAGPYDAIRTLRDGGAIRMRAAGTETQPQGESRNE
jgi:HlyD family secretion protein